jgi:hypothetical protein
MRFAATCGLSGSIRREKLRQTSQCRPITYGRFHSLAQRRPQVQRQRTDPLQRREPERGEERVFDRPPERTGGFGQGRQHEFHAEGAVRGHAFEL